MKFLECRYIDDNCLISRSKISSDIFDEFIELQSKINPTVKWVVMEFINKNKFFICNYKSDVKFEIVKSINGKFVRLHRYMY
jgi:hypothetical protein